MCGIFGCTLKPNALSQDQLKSLIRKMADESAIRGRDSWGIWTPTKGIRRGVGSIEKVPDLPTSTVILGHTRKATVGRITKRNSHPFQFGTVIGAHNGMVGNYGELDKKYSRSFEVDSQHLIKHIEEGKDFSDIEAWGAVEWVNTADKVGVNLCRISSSGDLAVAYLGTYEKPTGCVWMSVKSRLEEVMKSFGLPWGFYEVKTHEVIHCRPGGATIPGTKLEPKTATFPGSYKGHWYMGNSSIRTTGSPYSRTRADFERDIKSGEFDTRDDLIDACFADSTVDIWMLKGLCEKFATWKRDPIGFKPDPACYGCKNKSTYTSAHDKNCEGTGLPIVNLGGPECPDCKTPCHGKTMVKMGGLPLHTCGCPTCNPPECVFCENQHHGTPFGQGEDIPVHECACPGCVFSRREGCTGCRQMSPFEIDHRDDKGIRLFGCENTGLLPNPVEKPGTRGTETVKITVQVLQGDKTMQEHFDNVIDLATGKVIK